MTQRCLVDLLSYSIVFMKKKTVSYSFAKDEHEWNQLYCNLSYKKNLWCRYSLTEYKLEHTNQKMNVYNNLTANLFARLNPRLDRKCFIYRGRNELRMNNISRSYFLPRSSEKSEKQTQNFFTRSSKVTKSLNKYITRYVLHCIVCHIF